jgi:hypothetical protein
MAISSQYITDPQFIGIMNDLNIEISEADAQDLIDRSEGDLEAALCERFQVPLAAKDGGEFSSVPKHARQKIFNAMRAKIRANIALDKLRNLTFEDNQRFQNVHQKEFEGHIDELLEPGKVYGLRLTDQAVGAMEPMQKLGLAKHDDAAAIEDDPWL